MFLIADVVEYWVNFFGGFSGCPKQYAAEVMIFPRTLSFSKGHVAGWNICTTPHDSVAFANWSCLDYPKLSYFELQYLQCSKRGIFMDFLVKNFCSSIAPSPLPTGGSSTGNTWEMTVRKVRTTSKGSGILPCKRPAWPGWNLQRLIIDPKKFKFGKCISTSNMMILGYFRFGKCISHQIGKARNSSFQLPGWMGYHTLVPGRVSSFFTARFFRSGKDEILKKKLWPTNPAKAEI